MLTPKQAILLQFITDYTNVHGAAPSYDEMREAIGLKSKSGIHKLMNSLIERGFIEQIPNKARALRVVKNLPGVIDDQRVDYENGGARSIPMYGKIAAGTPILAMNDTHATLDIFGLGRGDYYALTVSGDSMIEAGIFDGDTVVIEHTNNFLRSDVIVCLVDDAEVTLKYVQKQGDRVVLVPANREYQPRILDSRRVQFQGKVVQLIRHF